LNASDKQPRNLYLLFFTELWERFGFYTLQTILVLYMTQSLKFTDHKANLIYAAFNALLYLTPAIGGNLADRIFGFQRSIIIGGVLLMVGYCFTALPGYPIFLTGLAIIICGNGMLKPNVSSIVGCLYGKDDPRRDGGFTIFYMGINIGSLIPPLFIGAVVTYYGWHSGFGFAALGMAIGLIVFLIGRKHLKQHGTVPATSPLLASTKKRITVQALFWLGVIITIGLCHIAFRYAEITDNLVIIASVILTIVLFVLLFKQDKALQSNMLAAILLILISVGFWALYNQSFTSLTLYAARNMKQSAWGVPLDAELMQFFNPFFIIVLSPFLAKLWIKLDHQKRNPGIPLKFAFAALFMCLGFA